MTRMPLTGAILLLSGTTWAADGENLEQLERVIVTAPHGDEPGGGEVLSGKQLTIRQLWAHDSAALLGNTPGVSLQTNGGISSLPSIHGMADDRLRVQVDGMNLISACPNHMNPPLSYIAPTNIGKIQVLNGVVPVSVGGDSIGGAILVDSREPEFATAGQGTLFKGKGGAFYRSNGNGYGSHLSATLAGEALSMTYSGSSAQSDNYKAAREFKPSGLAAVDKGWLDGNEVGSSHYQTLDQSLRLALRHENHLVDLKLGVQHIPYQGYPNQRMDMTDDASEHINLNYKGKYQWGGLDMRAYHSHTRHKMDFDRDKQFVYGPNLPSTIVAPGMPMDTEGNNTGVLIKADILLSERDIFRVGGEYQRYRLNDWWPPSPSSLSGMVDGMGKPATFGGMAPNTFWNLNNGQRDRLGAFAEWEAHWNPQWLTSLGVRVEQVTMDTGPVQGYNDINTGYVASAAAFNARDHQRRDGNVDVTAMARYTQDASRHFEFGYSQKTRSPNLYERYSWSMHGMALIMNNFVGDGNGYLGNPDLEPEVSHTLSVTANWRDAARTSEFKITPYYTYATDYIDAIRCKGSGMMMNALCGGAANNMGSNKFFHLQYANQSARIYGLDVSGSMPLGNNDWGNWKLKGLLSYTNGKNHDTGDDLYNIMPLNAKVMFTHQLDAWDSGLEFVMVKAKNNVSDVRQEMQTPGYGLVNLRSGYSWKQVRLDFGIDNLFDKFYALPLGGAYTGQGTTMSLNGIPWGIPVPGAGRSIYAGMTVEF
ncbi:MAG: TonB-dependent receptor [Magnetococcales bacterium]|nr:TonB-dependent receptor [Magnetococcales bacterium]